MNKRSTVGMTLSIAAAAGIATGAALHNVTSSSVAASAPPSTTRGTTGTLRPTLTTTGPATTTTEPPSQPPTGQSPTSQSPTTSAPAHAPLTAQELIGPADFQAAGVRGLRVTKTHEGGPNYDMSICPNVEGPGDLPTGSRAYSRSMANTDSTVSTYQLLVDFASTADADKHVRWLEDWHQDCGAPRPEDPVQGIVVGPIRTESIKGSDTSVWWDTAFMNEGKKRLETVAFTRSGTRVNVVVFAGPTPAIQYADMTTLAGRMAEKMG